VDFACHARGKIPKVLLEFRSCALGLGSSFLIQYFGLTMTRTASTNIALWWRFQ
jgi:hypothetical protein